MRDPKGFYTLREVCELTRLSDTTIWRMRSRREFPQPARRLPGLMLFRVGEINEWMAGNWRPPDDPPAPTSADDREQPPEDLPPPTTAADDRGQPPDDADR